MLNIAPAAVADAGLVRLGAGMKSLPKPVTASVSVADAGLVRLGAGMRGPVAIRLPATVADAGRVRLGAGMRR